MTATTRAPLSIAEYIALGKTEYLTEREVDILHKKFFTNRSELIDGTTGEDWFIVKSAREIDLLIRLLAAKLNEFYRDVEAPVTILNMLNGVYVSSAHLTRYLTFPYTTEFIRVTSYGAGTTRGEAQLHIEGLPPSSTKGREVLLLDELFDTGQTLEKVAKFLRESAEFAPKAVRSAVVFAKERESYEFPPPDFCGFFQTPIALWFVGYGLDGMDGTCRGWAHLMCKYPDRTKYIETAQDPLKEENFVEDLKKIEDVRDMLLFWRGRFIRWCQENEQHAVEDFY